MIIFLKLPDFKAGIFYSLMILSKKVLACGSSPITISQIVCLIIESAIPMGTYIAKLFEISSVDFCRVFRLELLRKMCCKFAHSE